MCFYILKEGTIGHYHKKLMHYFKKSLHAEYRVKHEHLKPKESRKFIYSIIWNGDKSCVMPNEERTIQSISETDHFGKDITVMS